MQDAELQFRPDRACDLARALREALGSGGRAPSRRRVAGWIGEGRVRVDGAVVTDPRTKVPRGARIDLRMRRGDEDTGPARPRAPEVLHLDRQLLVVEDGPVGPDGLPARLRALLEALGVRGLAPRPVPAPPAGASGIFPVALSPVAAAALERAFATGAATLDVDALLPGGRVVHVEGVASSREASASLGARRLHVRAARLAHPGTGRPLAFTARRPPFPRPAGSL